MPNKLTITIAGPVGVGVTDKRSVANAISDMFVAHNLGHVIIVDGVVADTVGAPHEAQIVVIDTKEGDY